MLWPLFNNVSQTLCAFTSDIDACNRTPRHMVTSGDSGRLLISQQMPARSLMPAELT